MQGLYVHIPFCVRKCGYCDFYSEVGSEAEAQRFLDAVEAELAIRAKEFAPLAPKTVFFGGGTPTKLTAPQLVRLGEILHRHVDLSQVIEWTSEINPGTLDPAKAAALAAMGVNRASFGVQSFSAKYLKVLDRAHEHGKVDEALAFAAAAGISNRSVDLIFALPEQTMAEWQDDLNQAIALGLDHLSLYNLTYEDDTPLTARMARGEVAPLAEELQAVIYEHTIARCAEVGLAQYETSNFARPGKESLHNTLYWRCANWLGIGPSAHSGIAGRRWGNAGDHRVYATKLLDEGVLPIAFAEENDFEAQADEMLMMGLRLRAGVRESDFRERLGFGIADRCGPALDALSAEGLILWDGATLKVSARGVGLLDTIVLELTRAPMALA